MFLQTFPICARLGKSLKNYFTNVCKLLQRVKVVNKKNWTILLCVLFGVVDCTEKSIVKHFHGACTALQLERFQRLIQFYSLCADFYWLDNNTIIVNRFLRFFFASANFKLNYFNRFSPRALASVHCFRIQFCCDFFFL